MIQVMANRPLQWRGQKIAKGGIIRAAKAELDRYLRTGLLARLPDSREGAEGAAQITAEEPAPSAKPHIPSKQRKVQINDY